MEQSPAERGFHSKISVGSSRKSNLSGRLSLEKLSWTGQQPSLQNRTSLVYAMSIESSHSRQSDLFRRLLDSENNKPNDFRGSANQKTGNSNAYGSMIASPYHLMGQRQNGNAMQDMEGQRNIVHMCQCYGDDCDRDKCPCYEHQNQLCLKGTCCVQCIKIKNRILQTASSISINNYNYTSVQENGYQPQNANYVYNTCTCKNTHCLKSYCSCFQSSGYCNEFCKCEDCENQIDSIIREHALQQMRNAMKNQTQISCTCKKTKCNKKYCSCYANKIKCGKMCSCEGCLNCDQEQNDMGMDIQDQVYIQDNNNQMPLEIEFQPVQFQKY